MRKENKTDLLYQQLRQRINGMASGDNFPTVRELMAEYKLSQATVSQAMSQLKERGLILAHVGRGTIVNKEVKNRPHLLLLESNWQAEEIRRIVKILAEAAENAGFDFTCSYYDHRHDVTTQLDQFDADVMIIDTMPNDQLNPRQLLAITRAPAPVIIYRKMIPVDDINYVCGDNYAIGAQVANYFYRMGHRKLALLNNEPHLYSTGRMVQGFCNFAGINDSTVTILDCKVISGERADRPISAFAAEIAAGKYDFTAMVTISNVGALKMYEELLKRGVRVPEDISLVSGCSMPDASAHPLISSIVVDHREDGRILMRLAHGLLAREPGLVRQICSSHSLVERSSVLNLNNCQKGEVLYA